MTLAILLSAAHILGVLSAIDALMGTRTSQGAVAWIVSLISFPIVAVPAYWIFGRTKFNGYVFIRRNQRLALSSKQTQIVAKFTPYVEQLEKGTPAAAGVKLAGLPYLTGHDVQLLINGEATFESILEGIKGARHFVLVQFYIVRDDELGRRLKDALIEKARENVAVYFLYDEMGSSGLKRYSEDLKKGGVRFAPFHSTRGSGNRFQLNFRNHRKIVVVDGEVGWVGGHNVGDEYLGKDPKFPNWRDTHVRIQGPSVLAMQLSFLEDWHWACDEELALNWEPKRSTEGNAKVLILPTGPADDLETCSLMFQQAIHAARARVWLGSPYFVPDSATMAALHLAALRGVDVKILIPETPDNRLVYYSKFAFLGELLKQDIEVYLYQPGFLHEKVFLVDEALSAIGTANLDNRSFRLNFEITALIHDAVFAKQVEKMFQDDFARSRRMTLSEIVNKPWWFKVLSRASYLTAPIQ